MRLLTLATDAATTTANATIVLVVVTGVLAVLTGIYARLTHVGNKTAKRAAKAARKSAQSAALAASAAEHSLLLAAMPLVLGYNFERLQDTDGYGVLLLNEGPVTAFNLLTTVTCPGFNAGDTMTLPPYTIASLASGREKPIKWRGDILPADGSYFVAVEFTDPLGHRYRTERHSLINGNSAVLVQQWATDMQDWATVVDSGVDET